MPTTGLPKGDFAEYVTSRKKRLQERWKPRNQKIDEVWARRRNERAPYVPEGFRETTQEFHAPFVRDLIRRSQAIIGDRPPSPTVIPLKVGPEAQANADKRELFLIAARRRMLQREDTWGMITDAFANDAEATWMIGVHLQPWGKAQGEDESDEEFNTRTESLRRQKFPFRWEHIPSKSYLPDRFDDDGLGECQVVTSHDAIEIAEKYDLHPEKGKLVKGGKEVGAIVESDYPGSCEVIRWYNRTHFATLVDDEVVEGPDEHDLGRPPIFHATFSTTSSKDPGFLTEGLADSILELQDKIENFFTAIENYIWESAFPAYQVRPVSEDAIPQYQTTGKKEIKKRPGKAIENLPYGHVLEPVTMPPIGPDLRVMLDFLSTTLDRVSLARILYAELQGDTSGPVATSLIAMAKSIFGPGLTNLARAMDETDAFMQEMIEKKIKHPVPVWLEYEKIDGEITRRVTSDWMELTPEDIDGYYAVENKLAPIIPLEQQQRIIQLTDGMERSLVTQRRVLEEGYLINAPEKELEAVEVEKYANLEMYKQMVFAEFQRRIGQNQEAVSSGSAPVPPVGPGGPVPQLAGVQQVLQPGFPGSPMMPPAGVPTGGM